LKKGSSFDAGDIYLEAVRKRRKIEKKSVSNPKKRVRKKYIDVNSPQGRFHAFMQQDVEFAGANLIPDGYKGITYSLLAFFLPKIVGMAFFFFYVAEGKPNLYSEVHSGGTLLDWAVGYEILLAISLLIIGKKLLGYVFIK